MTPSAETTVPGAMAPGEVDRWALRTTLAVEGTLPEDSPRR